MGVTSTLIELKLFGFMLSLTIIVVTPESTDLTTPEPETAATLVSIIDQ